MITKANGPVADEYIPFLRCLLTNGKDFLWLGDFFKNRISEPYSNFIDNELFKPHEKFYPYAKEIDRLLILKSFFTREKVEPYNVIEILKPLRRKITRDTQNDTFAWPAQKNQSNLIWQLQNDLSHAITKRLVPIDTFVTADADITLREIIGLNILFYMLKKINLLIKNDGEVQAYKNLKKWMEKEIANKVPSQAEFNMSQEKEEEQLLLKNNKNISASFLYFLNGASRLPICIQLEYIKIYNIVNTFKINTEYFARKKWKAKDLYLNLPMASFRFFLDVAFVSLLPYRLLRTLVNEITGSSFKIIRNMFAGMIPKSNKAKIMLTSLFYASQAAFYACLLISVGLPLLPNPIAWLPKGFMYAIPIISASYYIGVIAAGSFYRHFSNINNHLKSINEDLVWLPFKRHPTQHQPNPSLALYDVPKSFQFSSSYKDWKTLTPAGQEAQIEVDKQSIAPAI